MIKTSAENVANVDNSKKHKKNNVFISVYNGLRLFFVCAENIGQKSACIIKKCLFFKKLLTILLFVELAGV
jgi:hypothetical protein